MTYFQLTDYKNNGTIVRAEGRSHQRFIPNRGWVDSGIMTEYFSDESDTYNSYIEISEKKALELVGQI